MLRGDDEAVASTVATIFVLLVALMFLAAAFAVEEVRHKDREWSLVRDGEFAFEHLQEVAGFQYAARLLPDHYPDALPGGSVAVVIPVGMPAANFVTAPVTGRLDCDPEPSAARIAFSFRAGLGVFEAAEGSFGRLSLTLRTRQIPTPQLVWENGAVILVQSGGAVVLDYPHFAIEPLEDGYGVVYRVVRIVEDSWIAEGTGPEIVTIRTVAADSYTLNVTGRGDADLDDVREFVRDLKEEIRDVSTDGSGRLTGSYADNPPSEGILNQGLTEQLVYYVNAQVKQIGGDCTGAADDMNASARQLFQNVMDKILEGIDTGYIDPDYGLDLHTRMGTLLRCLDEMTGSLRTDCEFSCRSLFGDGGGRLEFLFDSPHRQAWARWFSKYLSGANVSPDGWVIDERATFVLVGLEGVRQLVFEEAYVMVR